MANTAWLCSKLQRALFAVRVVRAEDAYQGDDRDISSFFGELLPRVQEGFCHPFSLSLMIHHSGNHRALPRVPLLSGFRNMG
jgi:hypothetical protein